MPAAWVAAAATVYSAANSSNAASSAANAQQQSAQGAIAEQQREFDTTQANLAPYREAGTSALSKMMQMMGLGPLTMPTTGSGSPAHLGGGMETGSGGGSPQAQKYQGMVGGGSGYGAFNSSGGQISVNVPNSGYQGFGDVSPIVGMRRFGGKVGDWPDAGLFTSIIKNHFKGNGKSYVVGEEGPEILHMAPGSEGYVEPNPGTVKRMEGRATGGPVGDGEFNPPHTGFAGGYGTGLPVGAHGPVTPATPSTPSTPPTPFDPTGGNNQTMNGGLTPKQVMQMDPGYQFRLQQGVRAVDNSAAAAGGLLTGGHLKQLEQYAQGYASNEYSNIYARLAALASGGQGAAINGGYLGQNAANSIGSYMTNSGNAAASGIIGSSNAINQGIGNLAYLYGQQNPVYSSPGSVNTLNAPPQLNTPPIYGQG